MSVSLWLNSQDATRITPLAIKGIREMIIAYLNEAKWYYYQLQDAAAAGNYDSIVHCINNGAVPDAYTLMLSYSHNITDTRCYEILSTPSLINNTIAAAVNRDGPFMAEVKAGFDNNYLKWILSKSNMTDDQLLSAVKTSIKTDQIKLLISLLEEYPQAKVCVLKYIALSFTGAGSWSIRHYLLSQVLSYVSKVDMVRNCDIKDIELLNNYVSGEIDSSATHDIRYYFGVGPTNQGITLGHCQRWTIFGRCDNKCTVFNTACKICIPNQKRIDINKTLYLDPNLDIEIEFKLTVISGFICKTNGDVIYKISPDNKQCQAYCATDEQWYVLDLTPRDIDSLKRLHLYDLPEDDYSDLRSCSTAT